MKYPTETVHPDEACWGLREEPRMVAQPDGSMLRRWVQTVFVVRGDTIASHTTDYGPAENYERITPLFMPSEGENTVAQLREHADKNREDTFWWQRGQQQQAESTLIADHLEQLERQKTALARNHRTAKGLRHGY